MQQNFLRSFFSLLLLTIVAYGAVAQPAAYQNQIKVTPLRLIDPINPGLQILYERTISTRWRGEIGIMPIFDLINSTHSKGYRVSLEGKYFPFLSNIPYISLEAAKQRILYDQYGIGCLSVYTDSTQTSLHTVDGRSEYYRVDRKLFSINLKFGASLEIKRFVFDGSIGVGLKWKDVKHLDRSIDGPLTECNATGGTFDIHEEAAREQKRVTFNLPVKIGIGFRF